MKRNLKLVLAAGAAVVALAVAVSSGDTTDDSRTRAPGAVELTSVETKVPLGVAVRAPAVVTVNLERKSIGASGGKVRSTYVERAGGPRVVVK